MEKKKPCLYLLEKPFFVLVILFFLIGLFSKAVAVGVGYLSQTISHVGVHEVDLGVSDNPK